MEKSTAEDGFTLVELLVVLAILGLLAAFIAPQVIGQFTRAKADVGELRLQNLIATLDLYYLDMGQYPTTEEGLPALVRRPEGGTRWAGPYLRDEKMLTDPWGEPFLYRAPGEHGPYDLYTYGADKKEGGTADNSDLVSWIVDDVLPEQP